MNGGGLGFMQEANSSKFGKCWNGRRTKPADRLPRCPPTKRRSTSSIPGLDERLIPFGSNWQYKNKTVNLAFFSNAGPHSCIGDCLNGGSNPGSPAESSVSLGRNHARHLGVPHAADRLRLAGNPGGLYPRTRESGCNRNKINRLGSSRSRVLWSVS